MNAHLTPEANKKALGLIDNRIMCYNDFLLSTGEEKTVRRIKTRLSKKDKNRRIAIKAYRRRVGLRRF